jgi:hypothetical protein
MIPVIGLMIGSYVLTRMLQVMLTASDPAHGISTATKLFALVAFFVNALGILILLSSGSSAPTRPPIP